MKLCIFSVVNILIACALNCEDLYDDKRFHCEIFEEKGTLKTHIGEDIIWKRFSSKHSNSNLPALVGLHGGPGGNHVSMIPYKPIACTGRDVILYDQAGSGANKHYDPELTPWIRDISYYTAEIDDVVTFFKLKSFHLIGQSWGGLVTQAFLFDHMPNRSYNLPKVISVTHTSIFLSANTYSAGQNRILAMYPLGIRKIIERAVLENNFDSDDYNMVNEKLSGIHTLRTTPTPKCMNVNSGFNGKLYVYMQGPSEFVTGGVLSNWNNCGRLSLMVAENALHVPQMTLAGEFDSMHEIVVDEWRNEFRQAGLLLEGDELSTNEFKTDGPRKKEIWGEVHVVPQAGHRTIVDNTDFVLDKLLSFFTRAEMTIENKSDAIADVIKS